MPLEQQRESGSDSQSNKYQIVWDFVAVAVADTGSFIL